MVFVLDRMTKALVGSSIAPEGSVTVIKGFFDLTYARNTGAAFSILSDAHESFRVPFLLISTAAAIALLFYFIKKTAPEHKAMQFALALILGGAAGNLADRLMYGYVVDFIDWHIGGFHWPAFNVADSGITVGVVLLGIETIIRKKV